MSFHVTPEMLLRARETLHAAEVVNASTSASDVRDRAVTLARQAFRRWEALLRWQARHSVGAT